jgi:hypothetical protein
MLPPISVKDDNVEVRGVQEQGVDGTFEPVRDKPSRRPRELRSEVLHNVYTSPDKVNVRFMDQLATHFVNLLQYVCSSDLMWYMP